MSTEKIRLALDLLTETWRERTGQRDGVPTEVHEALLEVRDIERNGAEPRRWLCPTCPKSFVNQYHLADHVRACTRGTP